MKKSVRDYKNEYCQQCQCYLGADGYGDNYCYGAHYCTCFTPDGNGDLRQEVIDMCKEEGGFSPIEF